MTRAAKQDAGRDRDGGGEPSEAIALEHAEGLLRESTFRNSDQLGQFHFLETTGGGVAVLDMDRDGRSDVLASAGGIADRETRAIAGFPGSLHRNLGDWRFVEVGSKSGIDISAIYSTGISVGDYDADGFDDALVLGYGDLQCYRNQGDGTFERLAPEICNIRNPSWGASAAFLDANGDGLLDLYIVNYVDWSFDHSPVCQQLENRSSSSVRQEYCGPRVFQGLPDIFFQNAGDGSFEDRTRESGFSGGYRGMGVVAADLDSDGDTDLYVSNDIDRNLVYENDGRGTFADASISSGACCSEVGTPQGSMGVSVGDYNLDGRVDLLVTNFDGELPALYENLGKMRFLYASMKAKVGNLSDHVVSWGTAFADLDLDGDEDVLIVNGHIEKRLVGTHFDQHPHVYENQEGKRFRRLPPAAGFLKEKHAARSLAMGDLDQDGMLDFVVSRLNAEVAVIRNRSQRKGRFCRAKLVGVASNRNAIGAVVRLVTPRATWIRHLFGGGSYAASWEPAAHFGIPDEIDPSQASLEIQWPSGSRQEIKVPAWDQELWIVEDSDPLFASPP